MLTFTQDSSDMARPQGVLRVLLLFSTLLLVAIGCDDDLVQRVDASIQTFPRDQVSFAQVSFGEEARKEVAITNEGEAALRLNSVTWEGPESVTLDWSRKPEGIELGAGAVYRFEVVFRPTPSSPIANGEIVIASNDRVRPSLRLPVLSQQIIPRIQVTPSRLEGLDFGQVGRDAQVSREVSISNIGQLPLELERIVLDASSDFTVELPAGVELPYTIADNSSSLTLSLRYEPKTSGEDEGSLLIDSNDPIDPSYALPLRANSSTPCIQLSERSVEFFPAVAIGEVRSHVVFIKSCGSVPLRLEGITQLSGNSTELFVSEPSALSGRELTPDEELSFELLYSPLDEGSDVAEFAVLSNDPLRPQLTLEVLATAGSDRCPTAEALGRVLGSGQLSEQVAAIPLDTLVLDGTRSFDPESEIVQYNWELSRRPAGSSTALEDLGQGAARVFLDLAGDYEVCLEVIDAQGTRSCNRDCVQAVARPNEKLHVQLIWTTPEDPVVGDEDGADLDLHFLRLPYGVWGDKGDAITQSGWDVFFLNREPSWLIPELPAEYPSLDRDDTNGEGPENVNLDNPNACAWYAIGVHYFDDKGLGSSYATVRVYINGQLRFEKMNLPFDLGGMSIGDFWTVAVLHWDGNQALVFELAERYSGSGWLGDGVEIPQSFVDAVSAAAPHCAN
ncbi:MAG: choice-of-anchor D domain-containing protein [Myxococcota bacterium]|nr:choice-of-anchor D domain-containing protein [Myxococcota bacterium]